MGQVTMDEKEPMEMKYLNVKLKSEAFHECGIKGGCGKGRLP